ATSKEGSYAVTSAGKDHDVFRTQLQSLGFVKNRGEANSLAGQKSPILKNSLNDLLTPIQRRANRIPQFALLIKLNGAELDRPEFLCSAKKHSQQTFGQKPTRPLGFTSLVQKQHELLCRGFQERLQRREKPFEKARDFLHTQLLRCRGFVHYEDQ